MLKYEIRDIVRIAGTDLFGRVTNVLVHQGVYFVEANDGQWYHEREVLPQPGERFVPGDTIKHAGNYAVVRFIFQYADGLCLLDTTRGTFDMRDCEVAA